MCLIDCVHWWKFNQNHHVYGHQEVKINYVNHYVGIHLSLGM